MQPAIKSPNNIRFKFIKLKDLSLYFGDQDIGQPQLEINLDDLTINIDVSARLILESKQAIFRITVTYFFESDSITYEQPVLLQYKSETTFYIDNFIEVFIPSGDGGFKSPKQTSRMLIGIALSTIRGVLIANTANSYLRDYPLPIIHPDLIKRVAGIDPDDTTVDPNII